MGHINVNVGEPITLRLTLGDEDGSKYVKAYVTDDDNDPVPGSPFNLTHIGGGRYFFRDTNNLVFPSDTLELWAVYQVYDDDQYQLPTVEYEFQTEDVFRKIDIEATVNVDNQPVLDAIKKLTTMIGSFFGIRAKVVNDENKIDGVIDEDKNIMGDIDSENKMVDASVKDNDGSVFASVEENQTIIAIIQENDDGTI